MRAELRTEKKFPQRGREIREEDGVNVTKIHFINVRNCQTIKT